MKDDLSEKNQKENWIRVSYKGWGSPTVRAWILGGGDSGRRMTGNSVIWHIQCVSELMWTPGEYDVYKIYLAEPGHYRSRKEAEDAEYRACKVEYVAVRRKTPRPEPERYEQLLADFRPHLSRKHYEELLQELEGKTSEEKEELIREAMDELTTAMSYY